MWVNGHNRKIPTPKSDYYRGKGPTCVESSYMDEVLKAFAETERELYSAHETIALLREASEPIKVEKPQETVNSGIIFGIVIMLWFLFMMLVNR